MTTKKNISTVVAGGLALTIALAACGEDSGSGTTGGESGNGGSTKDTVTWMAGLHTPVTPDPNGPVEAGIEEYTGMNLEIQWYPDASKEERINAALASNTLADITSLSMINSTTVRQALPSGMFWDVEPYLAQFPNLAKIPAGTIDSARINGKLWGVPIQKPIARYGVVVRQDWLDNLGLAVPHTLDELAEVARAFTEDDPDGNGIDDTVGIIDRQESFGVGFRSLAGYFGAGNHFEVDDDGQVVPAITTDAWRNAMIWYRDLYEKGYINQEFVTVQKQNQIDAIIQGKGGIVFTGLFETKNYTDQALSADPNTTMDWALVNDMTYQDVPRRIVSDTNGGMGGWLAISTTAVPTEADLLVVLGFIDKLMDEDPFVLMSHGVEGTHFEYDADGVVSTIDQTKWEQQVQPYASSRPSELVKTFISSNKYTNESNVKMAENADYAVFNVAQSLTSETFDRSWSTLEQEAKATYDKYIMGMATIEDWDATLAGLRSKGMDSIIAEFTASYKEANS